MWNPHPLLRATQSIKSQSHSQPRNLRSHPSLKEDDKIHQSCYHFTCVHFLEKKEEKLSRTPEEAKVFVIVRNIFFLL